MPEKLHTKISPSKLGRILVCPGSVSLAEQAPEEKESDYAAEGTRAHKLAERWLKGNGPEPLEYPEEMVDAVRVFYAHCKSIGPDNVLGNAEVFLMSKGIEDFGGTIDFLKIDEETGHAWISDFKYGAGVSVVAEKNAQLLGYAVLVLENFPGIETFTLTIVQPRTPGEAVDSWTTDRKTVNAFRQKIMAADGSSGLCTGDHCRWCPAKTLCPALKAEAFRLSRLSFDDEAVDLYELFKLTPAIKALLDEVPGRMIAKIKDGVAFPGLKAVQAYGNRAWKYDDAETLRRLGKAKIGKKLATVQKLKSPAQLERDGYAETVAYLVERPERGIALVSVDDKRPSLAFGDIADAFEDLSFLN